MPCQDTLTADELGDLLGITSRSVRDLAVRGVIHKAGKGRYPVREAVRSYTAHLRDTAALRGGDEATSAARRRESEARALKIELANRQALGELVEVAEVERQWREIVTAARAALMAVTSRVRDLPRDLARKIDEEISHALERLSEGR